MIYDTGAMPRSLRRFYRKRRVKRAGLLGVAAALATRGGRRAGLRGAIKTAKYGLGAAAKVANFAHGLNII